MSSRDNYQKNVPVSVERYAEYVKKWDIKTIFNLDTNSVSETLLNQKYLEKNTNAYVIPVYHYSDYKDARYRGLLNSYMTDYPYIALGGTAEGATNVTDNKTSFFDFVFSRLKDKIKVHGLAITSQRLMTRYPFYSVDSTSCLMIGGYGKTSKIHPGGLFKSNKSINTVIKKGGTIEDPILALGYKERLAKNIKTFLELEEIVTKSWKIKGVNWDE